MAFWQIFMRMRRGELATLVFATFMAFALAPGAMAGDASLLPTEAHAVLFWLQGADTVASTGQSAEAPFAPPTARGRRSIAPTFSQISLRPQLRHIMLDAPVAAYLSGVRTNRILN
jgi:hypothetical protein